MLEMGVKFAGEMPNALEFQDRDWHDEEFVALPRETRGELSFE